MTIIILRLLALLTLGLVAGAGSAVAQPTAARPKIALALAGGGAAGAAHVGVIKALEALGIRPDCVVGTSMGAIVGGLYSAGYSPEELERVVQEIDWNTILDDTADRSQLHMLRRDSRVDAFSTLSRLPLGLDEGGVRTSGGLVDGVQLTLMLRDLTRRAAGTNRFDQFPIPFRAVAADLATGEEVILQQGDLALALRASMSIPGLFPPITLDGKILVDGGIANNLPIDVARDFCGDIVIAVLIPPAETTPEELQTLTGALGQTLSLFIHRRSFEQIATLGDRDVLIEPKVADVGVLDFGLVPEVISKGVDAVAAIEHRLAGLTGDPSVPLPAFSRGDGEIRYAEVQVETTGPYGVRVIEARLDLPPSGTIEPADLNARLSNLYGLDVFENVSYRLDPRADGQNTLVIVAERRRTGPLELRLGFELRDDFDGGGQYGASAGVSYIGLNDLGGRIDVDGRLGNLIAGRVIYEQPLDYSQTIFVLPSLTYTSRTVSLFPEVDNRIADFRVNTVEAHLAMQYAPVTFARVGAFAGWEAVKFDLRTGSPQILPALGLDDAWESSPALGVGFDIDTLDDASLPTSGIQIAGQLVANPPFSGDENGRGAGRVLVDGLAVQSVGPWSASLFGTVDGEIDPPEISPHFLGGFQQLSGLQEHELIGNVAVLGGARVYRIFELANPFGSRAFVGASAEYGGVADDWDQVGDNLLLHGSVFTGLETGLGPLIFSVGAGEDSQYAAHLGLGQRF